jgi:Flp pilus assembly protein TadD
VTLAERHLELNPEDIRALVLGATALMEQGKREQALDWARRGLALDPEDPGQLYNVACCHALGGEKEEALALLDKAIRNGYGHREWMENDSDLASLRDDPRFQSLLARL